jgi:hypothetical protein
MALLALLGMSAFALVSSAVGLHLILLARRTGLLPERLSGISMFLAGGLGSTLLLAAGFAGDARWLFATAAVVAINFGVAALGVFTWRVFRPTLMGATLVAACVMLLFLSMIVDRFAGHYLGAPRSGFSIAADHAGRLVLYGWATWESLRQYARARRRVRLGLTEPLVANRFLLWGLATGAALGIWLHALWRELVRSHDDTQAYLVITAFGGACALALWLAFFPPRTYRARFASGAVSAP